MPHSKSKNQTRSKSKNQRRSKSKNKTRSKSKKEVYYFSIDNINNHINNTDEKHYTNKIITPLYMNRDMNGTSVGYYTAVHTHTINKNKNNVHVEATIIIPNATILARGEYVTDKNTHYLKANIQNHINFYEETGSGYYKSPQIVLTVLDKSTRKISITYK